MKTNEYVNIVTIAFTISSTLAYHDPDLNYHLSQVQKISNCGEDDSGYSYPVPKIQLRLPTENVAATPVVSQPVISSPVAYSTGVAYQAPKITYAAQPAFQTPISSNYATAPQYFTKETHGYATSAGLSTSSSTGKTVTPLATYAQAPIIAKITAAPVVARFSISPPNTNYYSQNFAIEQSSVPSGSLARASLYSLNNIRPGGPVVSQIFAAPSNGYAASPALRIQQTARIVGPAHYSSAVTPGIQYAQAVPATTVQIAPTVSQYLASSATSSSKQYFNTQTTPVVTQYNVPTAQYTPTANKYATSSVSQYSAPVSQYNAPVVTQYTAPSVTHYSAPVNVQYAAPAVTHYSAPTVAQYSAPASTHSTTPSVSLVSQYAVPTVVSHAPISTVKYATSSKTSGTGYMKNIHTEFLENYDAHPRYAFEYAVNDPRTGDIKQQKEERNGDVVKGQYSLVEPDGSVRTVNYVADWETGFHADVRNSKDNQH
ncbi:hypothetical protein K1T71_004386 [Dendrolimus kikuchii]|uniref:Uncharacterized protein n=1 Tax=Dendrolimus kikuchii TaxID=765133 RepID=A0ACC1D7K3_9NEOP|nr:hypothetical protein K1T71_004386 [Dendrolimus kikuchii]